MSGPAESDEGAVEDADGNEALADVRQQLEQIDELDVADRVQAFERINEELVRALNDLEEM